MVLLKPFSDPSKLKSLTQFNGFDHVFQMCCTNELKLLTNAHNQNEMETLSQTLESTFYNEIKQVEKAKKDQQEKSKKLGGLSVLLQE